MGMCKGGTWTPLKKSQTSQAQTRRLGHPAGNKTNCFCRNAALMKFQRLPGARLAPEAPGDTLIKLILSPNLEYKDLTAKVQDAV